MSEEVKTIRYTQVTIDAALLLLQSGITIDSVFASVVEEHKMYRQMLGISEATFITLDLSGYDDEPDEDYDPSDEYDDGRWDDGSIEFQEGVDADYPY